MHTFKKTFSSTCTVQSKCAFWTAVFNRIFGCCFFILQTQGTYILTSPRKANPVNEQSELLTVAKKSGGFRCFMNISDDSKIALLLNKLFNKNEMLLGQFSSLMEFHYCKFSRSKSGAQTINNARVLSLSAILR